MSDLEHGNDRVVLRLYRGGQRTGPHLRCTSGFGFSQLGLDLADQPE